MTTLEGPIHAFLTGAGRDHRSRTLAEILAFTDAALESHHDYIQWLFPLQEPSRAVPTAPVLTAAEAQAIRTDPKAQAGLQTALARMTRFYEQNDHWLVPFDHNHLRITRILTALHSLQATAAAKTFYELVKQRNEHAGRPINSTSLLYWKQASAAAILPP